MKMLVVFVILLHVFQHAFAVVVEVNKGAESVLLPCQYSEIMPEKGPTVMWTRNELDVKPVHLRREEGDDLTEQNQRYSGRTSMRPDALITGKFDLTLRKPQLTDSSSYTCTLSSRSHGVEWRLADVKLQVKDQQVEVKVEEGSESVILPCQAEPDLPKDTKVEWTRSDRELMVHAYPNRNNTQDDLYCGRTKMNKDLLKTGDLSVTLKHPTERDIGGFICTIYRDKDILRQKVVLHIKEPFPSWATVLIVLLVLLVVSGGLLFHSRHYFMSGYKVEVDSDVESVQLPCKTIVHLPKDAKVEWMDQDNRKVHVYQSSSDQPEEQDDFYRGRTQMKRNLLIFGDLSLTLKRPKDTDRGTYTCTAYKNKGSILMKKQVLLQIKFPQVEVDSGVDFAQLPCKVKDHLTKVEWIDSLSRKVHVYDKGSDQPDQQDQVYRRRTKMNENPLKSGDLSLTLINPTSEDTNTYTCNMYNKDGNDPIKKTVELNVRVPQIQKDPGVESALLLCKATEKLPKDAKVMWKDTYNRKVHVYESGSDKPGEQNQVYRDRTKMNKDLPNTKDLSLTLKYPTDGDTDIYTCTVYSREGDILMKKQVELSIPVCQVEVEEGVESVQLPFKTTENLPGDATVKWERQEPEPPIKVHVYQSSSDQPGEQHQVYRDRTKMNEDLLKTGDLSLTLKRLTDGDGGKYSCVVYSRNIWRNKTVRLKVKGRDQFKDQTAIKNSSTETTPLVEGGLS